MTNDVDAEGIDFVGKGLGPSFQRPFRGAVHRVSRLTGKRSLARDENDAAVRCARNVGSRARVKFASTPKKFVSITRLDLGVGQILEHAGNGDTGIVHDRVERVAGLRQDGLDRGLDRAGSVTSSCRKVTRSERPASSQGALKRSPCA